MSAFALQITVDGDSAIRSVGALADGSLLGEVRQGMGTAVGDVIRANFVRLQGERSGKNGPPTDFYLNAAKSVQAPKVDGDDINISITAVGVAQRYFGGTIHAGTGISSASGQPTKFLAIPVDQEAYGKRPSDFPVGALQYIVGPSGPALILADHTDRIATKGKNAGKAIPARAGQEATHGAGSVMFVLRESVTQKPDPTVLPTEAQLTGAAVAAGSEQAQRILARQAAGVAPGNN